MVRIGLEFLLLDQLTRAFEAFTEALVRKKALRYPYNFYIAAKESSAHARVLHGCKGGLLLEWGAGDRCKRALHHLKRHLYYPPKEACCHRLDAAPVVNC